MKLCPKCGAEAQNESRFCKRCAYNFSASDVDATLPMQQVTATVIQCPNCGSQMAPGARMCMNCAAPLAAQPSGGGGAGYGYGYKKQSFLTGPNRTPILIASIAGGVLLLTGLILMIVLLSGGSGPGSVVKDAIYAIDSNNDSKVFDLAAKDVRDRAGRDAFKQATNNLNQAVKRKNGIKSVTIKKEDINKTDNKNASVEYELVYGDNDKDGGTAVLVKEDGRWKIVTLGTPVW